MKLGNLVDGSVLINKITGLISLYNGLSACLCDSRILRIVLSISIDESLNIGAFSPLASRCQQYHVFRVNNGSIIDVHYGLSPNDPHDNRTHT